ncbi:MAG TPA: DUF4301 family protein [Prolixibacteraceae bacterium]|nr:DUF4301 family protein [Prolixibacteraceae bacterium]
MFTDNDLKQISSQGLTSEELEQQIACFTNGFPPMHLLMAATAQNGIKIMSEDEEQRNVSIFENSLSSGLNTIKFVPASGAASRMFKDLYSYLETGEKTAFIDTFINNIEKFAFYKKLKSTCTETSPKEIIQAMLSPEGLDYGNKPKGLLAFHNYKPNTRTPFEEHLVETASYCTGSDGIAKVHFTVSPEHIDGFNKLLNKVKTDYQKRFGVKFDVSFSFQHPDTDTLAVDKNNQPFRDENGQLIFRPGGHGALLRNLSELDADVVFIKNIDNVVPDRLKHQTKRYKKALAGMLVSLRNKAFTYLEKLEKTETSIDDELLKSIENFVRKELCIQFEENFIDKGSKINFLKAKLDRPIRVCGMVKNEGEPGGGPFWAKNPDGSASLQIVEKAQIDLNNPEQAQLFAQSTHFNPVDLICSIKNHKGEKYDLTKYTDPQTGFISIKSKDGAELKALELPGLWNGAMSNWNTVFVEVPAETFNPVKTINDLLRPEHQ